MVEQAKSLKTIEDLEKLPANEKAELINGEIVMMAPANVKHSNAQSSLVSQLRSAVKASKKKGPDDPTSMRIVVEAWTYYEAKNSFVHDIAAFKGLATLPDKGPIRTLPFWVCEVLSPSNWIVDAQVKREVLEHFRIPYYWLVDPLRQSIQVLELPEGARHYQLLSVVARDGKPKNLSPFPEIAIDLEDVFA